MSGLNTPQGVSNQRYYFYGGVNAANETVLVTTPSNKRLQVHHITVNATRNATLAVAGRLACRFIDGSGGATFYAYQEYFQTTLPGNPTPYSPFIVDFDPAFKSTAKGNDLVASLGSALVTGRIVINIIYSFLDY